MEELKYPVGRFQRDAEVAHSERARLIDNIAAAPHHLRAAVTGLSDEQLDTPYRDGGWTVRQVVHHVPDSHLNAFIRFKWALTENNPTIKAYNEADWARLPDVDSTPVEVSLSLLDSLHERWVGLLRALSETDYARTLQHPENGPMTLGMLLRMYEWHGRHHVAHITNLRARMGWN
jgi:uncharacterized damage-inducible protein DinB